MIGLMLLPGSSENISQVTKKSSFISEGESAETVVSTKESTDDFLLSYKDRLGNFPTFNAIMSLFNCV